MRKIGNIVLIFCLLFCTFILPKKRVEAKTLGQLKVELAQYEKEYNENKNDQKLTEQQLQQTKADIQNTGLEIEKIMQDLITLQEEIEKLNGDIEDLDIELEELVEFYQISDGSLVYFEYVMGAKDYTDFIYRSAISGQLAEYNEELIVDYQNKIEENNTKTKQLEDKKVELGRKQDSLSTLLATIEDKMSELEEESISIEEEIRIRKEYIKLYENQYNCKDDEDIDECVKGKIPTDTTLIRPLASGYVTSNYGYRTHPVTGQIQSFHGAIDISTVDNNTPVYSAGAGVVVAVSTAAERGTRCGNNIVYIQHRIVNSSGKIETYTTSYWHMRAAFVKVGDTVTNQTQIGIMGGKPSEDSCSTGAHVHYVVATGLYLTDYQQLSTYNAKRINPRMVTNFPALHGYFKDRTTRY